MSLNKKIESFEDLIVWQKAHMLMLNVYELLKKLPSEERYNRVSQLRRSTSSIPSNIAEGFGRYHYQENIQFCRQARGSLEETKNHLIAIKDLKQAPGKECLKLIVDCEEVKKLLNSYINSTKKRQFLKNSIFIFLAFIFSISQFLIFLPAEAATLYLIPQSQTIYQDDSFLVEARINTEGEEINAVEVGLAFPSDLLAVVDFSKGNSILTLWPQEPRIQEEEISFLGGIPGGFKGEGSLAKITFLGKEIGKSEINFKESSKVLLNDGKGTPAELNFLEGNYEIIKKPENLPQISSRSHPDENKWYNNSTLHLRWDLVEGAEYSYLLSKDPLAEPDNIPDQPQGELVWMGDMRYEELDDGIYYFALKQKLPGEDWSEKITYRAMIDTTIPEPPELKIGKDPSVFEGKYFLSFAAQDKMSGVDYYEVKEGKGDWKRVMSPYVLEDQKLGQKIISLKAIYRAKPVIVRAYDKAGNYQTAEIKPPYKVTWKDIVIPLLILIGIIVGWWLWRKYTKHKT